MSTYIYHGIIACTDYFLYICMEKCKFCSISNTEELLQHPTHDNDNDKILTVIFPQRECQCRMEDGKYRPAVLVSPMQETGHSKPDELV